MIKWEIIYGYNDVYLINKDGQFKKGDKILETFLREDGKECVILIGKNGKEYVYLVSTLIKKYFLNGREVWVQIKGFKDRYFLSNQGRVIYKNEWGKEKFVPIFHKNGNAYVFIYAKANMRYTYYILTLMREYFPEVDYRDFKSQF